jgi:hypothetical protein
MRSQFTPLDLLFPIKDFCVYVGDIPGLPNVVRWLSGSEVVYVCPYKQPRGSRMLCMVPVGSL